MKTATLHDRCLWYQQSIYGQKWPDSIPRISASGRWCYGVWSIGSLFRNDTRYDGAYPRSYLGRARVLFRDVREREVLHLFSGSLPRSAARRFDINPKCGAELTGHVYELVALLEQQGSWRPRLILADPPYSTPDAKARYSTAGIDKAKVFRVLAGAVAPGGFVVWLDTTVPPYRKDQWQRWGLITVERSTGHRLRAASLFTRRAS